MQSSGLVSTMHLTVAGSGLGEVLSDISTGLQVSALFLNDDQYLGQNFLSSSLLLSPPHHNGAPLSHLLGFITLTNNTPVALQLQRSCTFAPMKRVKVSLVTGFCCSFLKEIPLWNLEKYVGPSRVGMANGKTSCVIGNWDTSAKRETPPWILSPSPQVHCSKAELILQTVRNAVRISYMKRQHIVKTKGLHLLTWVKYWEDCNFLAHFKDDV